MKDIRITENHPVKKRLILGPLGRLILKLINWNIVGDLPNSKKIIIPIIISDAFKPNTPSFQTSKKSSLNLLIASIFNLFIRYDY